MQSRISVERLLKIGPTIAKQISQLQERPLVNYASSR